MNGYVSTSDMENVGRGKDGDIILSDIERDGNATATSDTDDVG